MKIRVLISGAGGDVAQGVIQALQNSSLNIEIFTICISKYSSWLHKIEKSYLAPLVVSNNYIPFLKGFISEHNIDVFFPCIDSEIQKISENKAELEKTSCVIMVDDIEKVKITNDKYLTNEFLKNNNYTVPNTCIPSSAKVVTDFVRDVGFPIIAKKRTGQGGKDIELLNTFSSARSYIGQEQYILQEYIQGDDYEVTAGIYLDEGGKVNSICMLLRELKSGSTYRAKRIIEPELEGYFTLVAEKLGMKYLNIQARLYDKKAYIFEFNGRLSGTTGIISRVFNAPEMFIREKFLKEKIKNSKNNSDIFYVMRYLQDIIVGEEEIKSLEKRSSVKDEEYTGLWS